MKYYIRFATLVYFTFFTCVLFLWNMQSGEQTMQRWTSEAFLLQIKNQTSVPSDLRPSLKSGGKDTRNKMMQHLTWHWKDIRPDEYISNISKGETFCDGNFVGYENNFAKLVNVVIDPDKGTGRHGGENISEVLYQPETKEYYVLRSGYFALQCKEKMNYAFRKRSHLNAWYNVTSTDKNLPNYSVKWEDWTIAVLRYEYANIFHIMSDFYNAFLVAKAFKMDPGNITILWVDGHPYSALDKTWEILFGSVLRAGDIQQPYMFSHMIWGIVGYHSPLNGHGDRQVPYLEEFRSFVLTRHRIQVKSRLSCTKLKILIIWRRDYLAHPRKPSGSLTRKIKNEDELLESVKTTLPGHEVFGVQIDKFDMKKQLEMISNTDILVGMHGAGLTHLLFLPNHAGLVELCPSYWSAAKRHFQSFAERRNIHYLLWRNTDPKREIRKEFTVVDVTAVTGMITEMVQKICR